MTTSDAFGIRDEDLAPLEREILRDDADHHAALAFGARIAALPIPEGPPLSRVWARSRRRVWGSRAATGVLLLAAAALLVVVLPEETLRERGTGASPGVVHLEAAATCATGVRALRAGGAVRPEEGVVFRVSTSAPGYVWLTDEDGNGVWPVGDELWRVEAGDHVPGEGAVPLAYRPDGDARGRVTYRALLCAGPDPAAGGCASSSLALDWSP